MKVYILIAPASFKGTLSAPEAAKIIQSALSPVLTQVELDVCPVADGGDDTLAILTQFSSGLSKETMAVTGPLPEQHVCASYLIDSQQQMAVIEAAQAHGLARAVRLDPLQATSFGVGELMSGITDRYPGLKTLVVTLGGSASTDGGLGALQALGVRFYDHQNHRIEAPIGGGSLHGIERVEWTPRPLPAIWIATDVTHPLLGPTGTATVFAPQKGATVSDCQRLESGLSRMAAFLSVLTGKDHASLPGAGAAGGLAYGLSLLPQSEIVSGFSWLAEIQDLEARVQRSALVITGEGCLDATSLSGKATGQLLDWAKGRPCFVFCGQAAIAPDKLPPQVYVYPITEQYSMEAAMANPKKALKETVERAIPEMKAVLGLKAR